MFLDTMEPRTENKNSSLEKKRKNCCIMWAQIHGKIAYIVHKMRFNKIVCKIWGIKRG